jgi:metal-responsive CopG/Arc/MetJ family transcriptional regulator
MVRIPPELLDQLDNWIAARADPRPSRPEAIRRVLDQALGTAKPGAKPKRGWGRQFASFQWPRAA